MDLTELIRAIETEGNPRYYFLEEPESSRPILSAQFAFSDDESASASASPPSSIQVYVCLYKRRRATVVLPHDNVFSPKRRIPVEYLTFWMESQDGQYSFPSFLHSREWTEDEADEMLKTECVEKILEFHPPSDLAKSSASASTSPHSIGYKGWIVDDDRGFVFFDADEWEKTFPPARIPPSRRRHVWAIADEIVRKRQIFHTPVDPSITQLFDRHPEIWNIRYYTSTPLQRKTLDPPRQMYSVSIPPRNADPVPQTECVSGSSSGRMALPYPYSHAFADRHLFTETPLSGLPDESRPRRYAGFPHLLSHVFDARDSTPPSFETSPVFSDDFAEDDDRTEFHRKLPAISFTDRFGRPETYTVYGFLRPEMVSEIEED